MFKDFRRLALGCMELATAIYVGVECYKKLDELGVISKVSSVVTKATDKVKDRYENYKLDRELAGGK